MSRPSIALIRERILNEEDAYWIEDGHDFASPVNARNEAAALSLMLSLDEQPENESNELCISYCQRMAVDDDIEPGRPFDSCSNEWKLMQWAKDTGMESMVEPGSWGDDRAPLRGLMAAQPIAPGSVVISVPSELLINYDYVWSSDLGNVLRRIPGLGEEAAALIWTMVDRRDQDSSLHPFWTSLPDAFETGLSISDSTLDEIPPGSSLRSDIDESRSHLKEQFDSLEPIFTALCQAYPAFIQPSLFTWESFIWAAELWYAYSITCLLPSCDGGEGKQVPCLVPFVSLMNHNPLMPHIVHFSRVDPVTKRLNLTAFRPCSVGSQVFLSYGALPSSKLLIFYGFVPRCNPFDFVLLSNLSHQEDKETGELRKNLLKMGGLDLKIQKIRAPLLVRDQSSNGRLPSELAACLRLLAASKSELVKLEAMCGGGGGRVGKNSNSKGKPLRDEKKKVLRKVLRGQLSMETEKAAFDLLHLELNRLKANLLVSQGDPTREIENENKRFRAHLRAWKGGQMAAIEWGLELKGLS